MGQDSSNMSHGRCAVKREGCQGSRRQPRAELVLLFVRPNSQGPCKGKDALICILLWPTDAKPRRMISWHIFSFFLFALAVLGQTHAGPRRPSILYLMCDDLRPQLKTYGFNLTTTPNLNALAAKSLTFTRAYTQFPFCAPSRNSFMSGRRPDRTK